MNHSGSTDNQHISTALSSLPVLHKQVHSNLWVKCVLIRTHSSLRMSYEQRQSASLQFIADVTSSEFKYTHPANNVSHSFFPRHDSSKRARDRHGGGYRIYRNEKVAFPVGTVWPLTACFLIYKMEVPLCIHWSILLLLGRRLQRLRDLLCEYSLWFIQFCLPGNLTHCHGYTNHGWLLIVSLFASLLPGLKSGTLLYVLSWKVPEALQLVEAIVMGSLSHAVSSSFVTYHSNSHWENGSL